MIRLLLLLKGDDGLDCENLGNGSLITYAIISPVLLIAYCMDGPYPIQRLFLEPVRLFNYASTPAQKNILFLFHFFKKALELPSHPAISGFGNQDPDGMGLCQEVRRVPWGPGLRHNLLGRHCFGSIVHLHRHRLLLRFHPFIQDA